jgi:hypothetical protein
VANENSTPQMRERAVMISGSYDDVIEYRQWLGRAIEASGLETLAIEYFPGSNVELSLSMVRESAAYAAIVGSKYGYISHDSILNPDQLSLTELEYNEALRLKRPCLIFVFGDDLLARSSEREIDPERIRKLKAFRERVKWEGRDQYHYFAAFDDFQTFTAAAQSALDNLRDVIIPSTISQSDAPVSKAFREQAPQGESVAQDAKASITGETGRPLVFISASRADIEWRRQFEETLDRYHEVIEWWDDAKLETGMPWETETESAITRAQIAVILLSPEYLEAPNAIYEMARLGTRSTAGSLRLFPIVVRDCAWQDLPEIRAVKVWANGKPLERLTFAERSVELNRIALGILKLAGKAPEAHQEPRAEERAEDSVSPPEPRFSEGATTVLERARSLGEQSGRGRITSSCLLFGFAETAGSNIDASRFVRDMFESAEIYALALRSFLIDTENPHSDVVNLPIGKTSRNVASVLDYAVKIAPTVSPGADKIHQRHLLAALLNLPGRKGQLRAHKRLKELGIERSRYLNGLREFIHITAPEDNFDEWEKLLAVGRKPKATAEPAPSPFVEGTAGYTAEFCGVGGERPVADYLFVGTHANRLAELIALRETKLPLAIGLFGNWGSGKSHFMNLMDRRLKSLMDVEKTRPETASPKWCREIVPIYFNAWHYLDANLWASLVAQIFESLFIHLRPKENDLAEVQRLLEEASGATARATEEVAIAQAATTQARIELRVAEENRRREETAIDGLLHGLRSLLPEVKPQELQWQVAQLLDKHANVKTLGELRQVVGEASTLRGRVHTLWNSLWKQPGRVWRITWLVVAVVVPTLLILAATYLPFVRQWFDGVWRGVAGLLAGLPTLILSLRPFLQQAREHLNQIEGWMKQAERAQEDARETPQVMQATIKASAANATEEAARGRLAQAVAREKQLTEEAQSLAPERRLGRYIEQRAQSSDYRGQLGLVSLARRDFQELSNLFADAEALKKRVAGLRAMQREKNESAAKVRASQTGKNEEEAKQIDSEAEDIERQAKDFGEEADRIEKLSGSIDRIVLFVDDLDRCQPEKVVEILQAVHLLLAFPLFAVVVGVDQRCLRQSLRMQFRGLLTEESGKERASKNERLDAPLDQDPNERLATPLDYLEKIFHVPFHLPVMDKNGFGELISQLTEPLKGASAPSEPEPRPPVPPSAPAAKRVTTVSSAVPVSGGISPKPSSMPASNVIASTMPLVVSRASIPTETIGSVPLHDWERKALRDYHALIQTPRGATRLLNTYRLVRAGIPKDEWRGFSSGGEHRVAMLLLAAAAGYPASAREWFGKLRNGDPRTVLSAKDVSSTDPIGWNQFKNVQKETFTNGTELLTNEIMAKWIQRVEIFTF